jgi:hypothetical protein
MKFFIDTANLQQIADACVYAEIPDSKFESRLTNCANKSKS